MKHHILLLLSFFLLVACSQEEGLVPPIEEELVPVHFKLSFDGMKDSQTRAAANNSSFGNGSLIKVVKAHLYNTNYGPGPTNTVDIPIVDIGDRKGADVTLMLPKGQTFNIIFLGTAVDHTMSNSKLYLDPERGQGHLFVDYSQAFCNDEEYDCFYAYKTSVKGGQDITETIELKRPFAQLNIGTADLEEYNKKFPIKNVSVSIDNGKVYTAVDPKNGQQVAGMTAIDFKAAPIPTDKVFPVDGYSFLAMNYLLVDTRRTVNVKLTINHVDESISSKILDFREVSVERNYQTNILLSKGSIFLIL